MTTAQMLQTVIEYDLDDFITDRDEYDFGEAHRQLSPKFAELEPGSMVRLKVHKHKPIRGYIPCERTDIFLQIISSDADVAKAWRQMLEPEAPIEY